MFKKSSPPHGASSPQKEVLVVELTEPSEWGKLLLFAIGSYTPIWFVLYWIGKINILQIGFVVYMVSFDWWIVTLLVFVQASVLYWMKKKQWLPSPHIIKVHIGLLLGYCIILCGSIFINYPIDWQSTDAVLGLLLLWVYYLALTAGIGALGYYWGRVYPKTRWM